MPRSSRQHRVYALLTIGSLALAVGATLTVGTVVNALWLKQPALPDRDRLVTIVSDSGGSIDAVFGYLETKVGWTAFDAMAGQVVTSGIFASLRPQLQFEQVGREVETVGVTSRYFQLLGQAIRGRDFTPDDNRDDSEPVAVISDRLWSQAFGRRTGIIGAVTMAKPFPVRIIGVAPNGFEGARRGEHIDIWIPSQLVRRVVPADLSGLQLTPVLILAKLRPGQTAAEAKRQLVESADVQTRRSWERLSVVALTDVFGSPNAPTIVVSEGRAAGVVAGLAGLVLLGGCVTVMALVLVHYESRRRELAIRLALGASCWRISRLLATEMVWLWAGGTAGALLVAFWSLRVLPALTLPGGVNLGRLDLSFDWRVLIAAILTTLLALVAAASVPINRFSRIGPATELLSAGLTPPSSHRLRQILLALHVSATMVVLVAAGLFVRSVIYGFSAGYGVDVERTIYLHLQLGPRFVSAGVDHQALQKAALERTRSLEEGLRSLARVESVALGPSPIVSAAANISAPRTLETSDGLHELRIGLLAGSPELVQTLGVPILKGRVLAASDGSGAPRPALITAALARKLWPVREPLDQAVSLRRGGPGDRGGPRFVVVGVVADFVQGSLMDPPAGVLISVDPPLGRPEASFVVRTDRPELIVEPVRQLVKTIIPDVSNLEIATGRELVARDLGALRLGAWFFCGFGIIALVLGAGGVFGLVAHLAASRYREFGVRVALGATRGNVVWRGILAGLLPVGIGSAVGLLLAGIVARVFVSTLPGLSTLDPLTYTSVALVIVGGGAFACIVAAWRLRAIMPADALRSY